MVRSRTQIELRHHRADHAGAVLGIVNPLRFASTRPVAGPSGIPVAKIWLGFNSKPNVRDDSHGFWRRVRLITLTKTFEINRQLESELRSEAIGIVAWLVRGCLAWQERGLDPPKFVTEATEQYRAESDPLADFISEMCIVDPSAQIAAGELYAGYVGWADHRAIRGPERLSGTAFGRYISKRFPSKKTNRGRIYRRIKRRAIEFAPDQLRSGGGFFRAK